MGSDPTIHTRIHYIVLPPLPPVLLPHLLFGMNVMIASELCTPVTDSLPLPPVPPQSIPCTDQTGHSETQIGLCHSV